MLQGQAGLGQEGSGVLLFRLLNVFVWGMVGLIIALIGAIILEGMYLVLTSGKVSMELLAVISGLVGSLTTCVVMGKRT
jgi:hypothetical protein